MAPNFSVPALRQQGFALVLVLWVLSLLTIMAGSFALTMRREAAIISAIKNNAEASAVAESGIAIAEMMLMHPDQNSRWRTDGSIYQITNADILGSDNAEVRVRMLAESGKIDINKADQKLLEALLAHSPIEDQQQQAKLVGAIIDWRDEDDLIHLDGAEKNEYHDAGLKYQPRNKPFQTIEELQLVLGMNEATYQWLENLITVYSGRPTVDLQQASRDVLQVLPEMEESTINDYLAARQESSAKGLAAPLSPSGSLQNAAPGQRSSLEQTSGESDVLTIVSEALLEDGARAIISAVIQKSGGTGAEPFQALEWHRNAVGMESLFAETVGASAISELLVQQYAESEFKH